MRSIFLISVPPELSSAYTYHKKLKIKFKLWRQHRPFFLICMQSLVFSKVQLNKFEKKNLSGFLFSCPIVVQVKSSEASPWEAYKEQDYYVATFGIGTLGISESRASNGITTTLAHHPAGNRPATRNRELGGKVV